MKIKKTLRKRPGIDAATMADIAFLLLIFFLVSSVITGKTGLSAVVPEAVADSARQVVEVRNLMKLHLNADGTVLLNGEQKQRPEALQSLKQFVDNRGRLPELSESTDKALIVFTGSDDLRFEIYLAMLADLHKMYDELRAAHAGMSYEQYTEMLRQEKNTALPQITQAIQAYPIRIAEP